MSSVREQIIAALATKLTAAPAIATTVERSRVAAFNRADSVSVWVEPVQDNADQFVIPKLDWQLVVRVGIVARGAIPDQVADPAVSAVHARVMSDLTLAGLCYDIQPRSTAWQLLDADNAAAVVTSEFTVLYRTPLQSITEAA